MLGTRAVAIELGRKRLCALQATFRRSGVVVRRTLVESIPADLSRSDPEPLGRWLRETLTRASMNVTRAVVALSRDEVILKRLTLPTIVDDELPDMTRLAVSRELPFDAAQAVIDFVQLEKSPTSTTVLALAMPRGELEAAQRVFKAAGIEVARVSLRAMGAAALMASVPGLKREPALLIDIAGERIEFSVVVGGSIRFSRAADLPAGAPSEVLTEAILTETRRTWMSYRIGDDTDSVRQVILLGDESAAELASEPIAGVLNITPIVLHGHPQIERGHLRLGVAWPLAGLLLEQRHQEHVIDMAHPRKAPDVHARMRMRALIGAAALIAVCGGAFTLLRADLIRLQNTADQLQEELAPQQPTHWRFVRDVRKLEHIRQWEGVEVDWLRHLEEIGSLVPARGQLVLNDLSGTLKFSGVEYESPKRGEEKEWKAESSVHISLLGEARDRELADAFRAAILGASHYSVSPSGVEREGGQRLGVPFNYNLESSASTADGDAPQQRHASTGELPGATP